MSKKSAMILIALTGGLLAMKQGGTLPSDGFLVTIEGGEPAEFRSVSGAGVTTMIDDDGSGPPRVQVRVPDVTLKRGVSHDGVFVDMASRVGSFVEHLVIQHGDRDSKRFVYETCLVLEAVLADRTAEGLGVEEQLRFRCREVEIEYLPGKHGGSPGG